MSIPVLHTDATGLRTKPTEQYRPLPDERCLPGEPGDSMCREQELRAFCRRLLGWAEERAGLVEDVMHSLLTAAEKRTPIALRGASDLVPIAHALHRRLLDGDRPFVVCNPRRNDGDGSVRSPPNRRTGLLALEAAAGGSVCFHANRAPPDLEALAASFREGGSPALLFVCLRDRDPIRDLLSPPIEIPSLAQRAPDLERLVDEYLDEAAHVLGVLGVPLSASTREAVLRQAASLADVEKTTLRLVAIMSSPNMSQAAGRLHIAPVSLTRWVLRRRWSAELLNASR